ncbi:MAG TPA: hypothetical protein VF600_07675 [Abditibacteriaceae bacterium]|jgi:hypothetical protein
MNTTEWIIGGGLAGAVMFTVGVAVLNFILGKVAPRLVQWNKAPAIPATIFYGFVAFCGTLCGGYMGYVLSDTASEQRLSTFAQIFLLVPVCIVCQRLLDRALSGFRR